MPALRLARQRRTLLLDRGSVRKLTEVGKIISARCREAFGDRFGIADLMRAWLRS